MHLFKKLFNFLILVSLQIGILSCNNQQTGDETAVETRGEKRILVFSKTSGYRHESIEAGKEAILKLGSENNFKVDTTENADVFTEENLKKYSAVVFLNTTLDVFDPRQEVEFERYIQSGGGYVGIHAAADTEYNWPWYNKLVGAYFAGHPNNPNVRQAIIDVVDKSHPATEFLPERWERSDEWYDYRSINPDINVLAKLDTTSYEGGQHFGAEHPIAWYHEFDGGRAFYTGSGHTDETFSEPLFLRHLLEGINFAIGENKQLDYNKATSQVTEDIAASAHHNVLTQQEVQEGWELLFNGKSTDSWKGFKKERLPRSWVADNGTLLFTGNDGGDIITKEQFENFELSLDWKIIEGGNSGIFFGVVEDDKYNNVYDTGPEMQILDDERHPDAKKNPGKRIAGANYDLYEPSAKAKPAGEWNSIKLVKNNNTVEHWMNGEKVIEYEIGSDKWKEDVKNSKFIDMPDYGLASKGHIALQDHGDKVWFRNIKIKQL